MRIKSELKKEVYNFFRQLLITKIKYRNYFVLIDEETRKVLYSKFLKTLISESVTMKIKCSDKVRTFDFYGVREIFEHLDKIEGDNYDTRVKYYEMNSGVEGSILVKGKHYLKRPADKKFRKSDEYLNKYKGKFKPSDGNVFYGKSDPNFEVVEKVAKENYKGETIKKQGALNLFSKTKNVIVNKVVSLDVFKELVEKHRPKAKMNQELVKQMAIDYGNAVKNGASTVPLCRTLCFHVLFLVHVSKTQFFACFSGKICSPGGNPLGHGETKSSQNDRKNTGFWKLVA